MAGDAQEFLHFVQFGCLDGHKRVFLAIDGLGLECRENFAERHRHGIGAQRLESVEEDVVLHHAHLDAVEFFRLGDRALAVGQVAKTVLPVGQVDQPGFFELLVEIHAGRAVEHRVGFFLVGKQERQVERAELFHDAHQRRTRGAHHLLGASPQCLGGWQVTTRRAAPEGVDLHLATGSGVQHFLHLLHTDTDRMVFVHPVGELDGALGKLRERRGGDQHGGGHQGGGEGSAFEHGFLLWVNDRGWERVG